MSKWVNHANVSAILFAYFPTSEGGPAVASVLFGDVNPSGKLPFTIASNISDYDTAAHFNGSNVLNPSTDFSEGTLIDYRYFDARNTTPLYEFGFGLSYTTCVLLPVLPSSFLAISSQRRPQSPSFRPVRCCLIVLILSPSSQVFLLGPQGFVEQEEQQGARSRDQREVLRRW
jgi:hypothetical protein